MNISAKVIAHSVNAEGKEILTVEACYPRFIHSEVMTHRVFSRNAMSSRAVPVAKMIDQVRNDPARPLKFMLNEAGMQSTKEGDDAWQASCVELWAEAANSAADLAQRMLNLNVHKQFANRLLEPFQWMRTIITATEWDNFYELRDHPDAQPEFRALAQAMRQAAKDSTPVLREETWHLPYVSDEERRGKGLGDLVMADLKAVSAARCARDSYLKHDGTAPSIEEDLKLFDRLVGSVPLHASPIEHQAFPFPGIRSGNFCGWKQFRQTYTPGAV